MCKAAECSAAPGETPLSVSFPCELSHPFRSEWSLLWQPGSALLDTHRAQCGHCRDPGNVPGRVASPALPLTNPFTTWVFYSCNRDFPPGFWIVMSEGLISTHLSVSLYCSGPFSNKEPGWLKLSPESISDLPLLTLLHHLSRHPSPVQMKSEGIKSFLNGMRKPLDLCWSFQRYKWWCKSHYGLCALCSTITITHVGVQNTTANHFNYLEKFVSPWKKGWDRSHVMPPPKGRSGDPSVNSFYLSTPFLTQLPGSVFQSLFSKQ